jgi:hypothetical protein
VASADLRAIARLGLVAWLAMPAQAYAEPADELFGLLPIMTATGIGADVMKRLSTPMFGGLVSLVLLTLFVVPVIYFYYGGHFARRNTLPPSSSLK